ncbi:hypothetical protein DID76_01595 [Candidatus Marinamargulisbacteria bacterium SCGC AG-414-C22]|nr:hypothetical protein DID76_01595 [Candidatus Marinamargulisbacteria bacterium SCGC AG-414-C22]
MPTKQKTKKILIFDNDKSIKSILEFILTQHSFNVSLYNNEDIYDILNEQQPHLILLDENIEEDVTSTIFSTIDLYFPKIPILKMIGKKISIETLNYSSNYVLGYIYKPLDAEEVLKITKQVLNKA